MALGSLEVRHIPARLQLADIFTKSLPTAAFQSLRFKLGVDFPSTHSLRGSINGNDKSQLEEQNDAVSVQKSMQPTKIFQAQSTEIQSRSSQRSSATVRLSQNKNRAEEKKKRGKQIVTGCTKPCGPALYNSFQTLGLLEKGG